MGRISNTRHLHCFFGFTLLTKQPTSHSHNNAVIITTRVLRHSTSSPARQAIRKVRSWRRRSRKRRGQSIPRIRNPSKPQQLAGRFISFSCFAPPRKLFLDEYAELEKQRAASRCDDLSFSSCDPCPEGLAFPHAVARYRHCRKASRDRAESSSDFRCELLACRCGREQG